MIERGWTDDEIKDLMGRNVMRVMDEVDVVAESYPYAVREAQKTLFPVHDEL